MNWELPRGKIIMNNATRLMGVINLTPDSFSDPGQFQDPVKALDRARSLANEGADIIDLGAESTRPGSEPISVDEECARLLPALKLIRQELDLPLSSDTYKAGVAREALRAGAEDRKSVV